MEGRRVGIGGDGDDEFYSIMNYCILARVRTTGMGWDL